MLGLVCLNTPFLYARKRSFGMLAFMSFFLSPSACLAYTAMGLYLHWRHLYPGQYVRPFLLTGIVVWPLMLIANLLADRFSELTRRFVAALEKRQADRTTKMLSESPATTSRVLCLSITGDEPYFLLSTVDWLTRFVLVPVRAAPWILILLGTIGRIVTELTRTIGLFEHRARIFGDNLQTWTLLAFVGAITTYLLGLLLMTVVLPFLRDHTLSFGETFWDSLLIDIRVKPFPQIGATHQIIGGRRKGWLRHSSLHEDPRIARDVGRWCYELLRHTPSQTAAERVT